MKKNKLRKITVSFLLTLFALLPIVFFIVYPQYTGIAIKIKNLSIYRSSREKTLEILTNLFPSRDSYSERVLGIQNIEESISISGDLLEEKLLEELGTTLSIPSLNIEGKIYQGVNSLTMDKGFWHYPVSRYPGEKGNVVIIGHRYLKLPPARDTFFNLDKIKTGDTITIKLAEAEYKYVVIAIGEVSPNDISTVQDTEDYRLTLITCTPLWTSEKRLVITAKLDKLYKKV